ncbi:ras-like protein family member 11A-like isoform X2 [Scleropages formosus]|uniref:ras-like protein family member 11A-like isoform X2 n=1 Tax=Scleropages formosus TaxID=113540 RepID=UPI0010FA783D|nr:ras-like protein family member 11A-like isoform X2 [Scleropages formosus]
MSGASSNFLLVPIPESSSSSSSLSSSCPAADCVSNRNVKIAVLGASGVGKTALVVRFLTKRFIGDYEPNTGALYSREINVDGEQISLQVQDTPCVSLQVDAEGLHCQEQINRSIYWADGYLLVFSITDQSSYRTIQPLYRHIRRIHPNSNIPVIFVGNKSDLLRARQVATEEGEALAAELGGTYFEASAREDREGVHVAFLHLCHEVGRAFGGGSGEKRWAGLHLARPKSPNMQELKRRFRQVLSSRGKSSSAL